MSGDAIAAEVKKLHNPNLEKLHPDNATVIESEVLRYKGQQIPLSTAKELLVKLNAWTRELQSMSPESKAAAEHASMSKAVLSKVTTAVRDQLYNTLEGLGEQGIREAQRDYGSMSELHKALEKNIPRAERMEARKPRYTEAPITGYTRHPLLAAAMVGGGMFVNPILYGAPPAVELLRTIKAQASTPNALIKKALASYA